MSKPAILIVEDEAIVAADLAGKLKELGYEVAGTAAAGEEAVALACRLCPNLVLMDISLKGPVDGIEAAEAIRRQHDVPVIYLTAHSDPATLARAKMTDPFGYILKPFEEQELATQIELALYKHQADRQLREQREWLRVTLTSIGDAVIATDSEGRITFVNPVAESLTGWKAEEASGQPVACVFRIINEQTGRPLEEPVARVLREGRAVELANHAALVTKDGRTVPIEDSAAPILDSTGRVIGAVLVFHDVTGKRRAEDALRRSSEFPEQNPNPVLRMAADGTLLYANAAARDWLAGWGWQAGGPLPAAVRSVGADARAKDRPIETEMSSPASRTLWVSAVRPQGEDYVNLYGRDATDRKRAEEDLRRSREDLSRAQEVGQMGWWRLDTRRNVLTWSDENHRIFGVPKGTPLTYEAFLDTVHPDDRHYVDARWNAGLRGEPYDIEHRIVVDGQVKWVREKAYLEFNGAGQLLGGFGITQDITERKRREERARLLSEVTAQLLASDRPQRIVEDLCRRVMEHLGCQVFFNFLVDEHAGRLRLNACAGIPEEAARQIEWLDYGVALCGCAARDGCRIVAEHIQTTPDPRTELVRGFGVHAYACHPLLNQGEVIGTLSFGSRGKPAFADDELELMKTVADHVAIAMQRIRLLESLEQHARAAEAANEAKSQFLANMSHELRTPMNAILGMIEVALPKAIDPTVKDCLQTAKGSADLLLTLLDDLLDSAKIESGKLELESAPFSLRRMLDQLTRVLSVRASEKGLLFYCRVPNDAPDALMGDRVRLQQVLLNLAGNAIKFTERGEVEIVVKGLGIRHWGLEKDSTGEGLGIRDWGLEKDGTGEGLGIRDWGLEKDGTGEGLGIRDWGLEKDNTRSPIPDTQSLIPNPQSLIPNPQSLIPSVTLEFAVRDTGIGIAPSGVERLFQPFGQVDASMSRRFGGTGLGLSICKSLVEMMGGRIWVESQVGQGSTFSFTVRLPLAKELPPDVEAPAALPAAACGQLRILLVEDNPANQKLATYILQDRGHVVTTAGDGQEALYLTEQNCYDVILMDVQMPGMNGLEATAAIRKREAEKREGLGIRDWELGIRDWGLGRAESPAASAPAPRIADPQAQIPDSQSPIPSPRSPIPSRRVPIIAMTAHAMRGDRDRCLAAGMDGYLSKPVNAREMIGLIESLANKGLGIRDWGLGGGGWGLGARDWRSAIRGAGAEAAGDSALPNPQSLIPNPQSLPPPSSILKRRWLDVSTAQTSCGGSSSASSTKWTACSRRCARP